MRQVWLFLTLLGVLLSASTAEAARLVLWRFERGDNRLVFQTDSQVRPRAQLISNPTRLVIDLPGIRLGGRSREQRVGGAIASVRVGQFNSNTARLVVEMSPGYTMDPNQIEFQGATPTQWSVKLPTPERISQSTPPPLLPKDDPVANSTLTSNTSSNTPNSNRLRITQNGFFVRLDENPDGRVEVQPSTDGREIAINLDGVTLPEDLTNQQYAVESFGVDRMSFEQLSNSPPKAKITMNVNRDSPNWRASLSRYGGLAIVPEVGAAVRPNNGNISSQPTPEPIVQTPNSNSNQDLAQIESVALGLGNQILIRSNRPIQTSLSENRAARVYQIRIPNARLADNIRGAQLPANSPVSQIRVRQHNEERMVEILVQPAQGVEAGELNQLSSTLFALELRRSPIGQTPPPTSINLPVPAPNRPAPNPTPTTPPNPTPSGNLPRVNNARVLVMIDPGHGGKDPGAIGIGGLREKDVVLPISLEVSRLLRQQGAEVMLTRDRDYFVSLAGRTQMANRARANIFVSIHANAISMSRPDVNGVETYYYSASGRPLAAAIQNSILSSIGGLRNRGVKQARFYVLRNSSMPAALAEVGFVTGRDDAPRLAQPAFRSQMAEAIARGILNYINSR